MSALPSDHDALTTFSWNGIDCVDYKDREQILKEMYRVTRPGGLVLFSTHNRGGPGFSESPMAAVAALFCQSAALWLAGFTHSTTVAVGDLQLSASQAPASRFRWVLDSHRRRPYVRHCDRLHDAARAAATANIAGLRG